MKTTFVLGESDPEMVTIARLLDAAADRALAVGQHVTVRWGYGSGFRARGHGVIVRVSRLSVQVALSKPVPSPYGGAPWPAGHVLTGIPRFGSKRWHAEFGVTTKEG